MSPEKNKNVAYFGNYEDPEGLRLGWINWYVTDSGHRIAVFANSLSEAQKRISEGDLEENNVHVVIVDESLVKGSGSKEAIGGLVDRVKSRTPGMLVIRYASIDPQSGDTFVQKISTGDPVTTTPSLRTLAATISKL